MSLTVPQYSNVPYQPVVHLFGGRPGADNEFHNGDPASGESLVSDSVNRGSFLHHTILLMQDESASGFNEFTIEVCPYPAGTSGLGDVHWVVVGVVDPDHPALQLSNFVMPYVRAVRKAEVSASPCTLVICSDTNPHT